MATGPILWTPTNPAPIEVRAAARSAYEQRKKQKQGASEQVTKAIADPLDWVRQYTKTYNEHWIEEGRPTPYESFPDKPYFRHLFDLFLERKITMIEKSRDMMVSWACVAYFTWEAMRVPMRGVVFQTQKEKKVKQLIKYAKCLYEQQPAWLKEAYPLTKPLDQQSDLSLEFAHGSNLMGIPGGADQIRSYHPWGYFNDETAFQPEAGECYDHALPAAQKIICNSSAGPGWFADFVRDINPINEDE